MPGDRTALSQDPAYVHEAAKRGVFAYIVDDAEELQSAIDITLQRFTEYHNLQGAFGRRAVIEQAKGILMARHAVDADRAFEMLRDHSQHNGRKLVDVAEAIVDSHLLRAAATPRTRRSDHPGDVVDGGGAIPLRCYRYSCGAIAIGAAKPDAVRSKRHR